MDISSLLEVQVNEGQASADLSSGLRIIIIHFLLTTSKCYFF